MSKRIRICSAILLILLGLSVTPALGVTVKVNALGTTTTTKCDLDNSAEFDEKTMGGSGGVYQKAEISGNGENSVEKKASGDGYAVMSAFGGSGSVKSQMSAAASERGAVINSQTGISGTAGYIASASSTEANDMASMGWFAGDGGYLSSDLTAAASERSYVGGSAEILGVNCLDGEISNSIASGGDVLMNLDGLYEKSSGDLGNFGMTVMNQERSQTSGQKEKPSAQASYLNDPNSYKLAGWKWANNSNVQLYLRSDGYLSGEGLTSTQAKNAISGAAETWDAAVTNQNLFNNNVAVSSTAKADKYDGRNVHAWKPVSSTAIAYARTYYYPKIYVTGADGKSYWKAVESDVCYNTRYGWSTSATDGTPYTSGAKIDVQSVALHELGHTLGLGDIYGTDLAWDTSQIMNSYNDVQRTLGAGDVAAVQKLYGA